MSTNPLLQGLPPVHPGALLREDVVPATGKTEAEIAELLGMSLQAFCDILAERQPVTAAMALRIGKLFGNGPDLWLSMQTAYDLQIAEAELADVVDKIPTLSAA
jgi:addiction module HigA family antidote